MPFAGFPRDTLYTPTPDPLFGPLLEEIRDVAELKVTLRGLWLLRHKRQSLRVVSLDEFLSDTVLLRGLRPSTDASPSTISEQTEAELGDAAEEIRRGLRLTVRRGVLLAHESGPGKVYFALNSDAGRRALARLKETGADPGDTAFGADEAPAGQQERPNIFVLYEDTIGLLSPIIAERLKEAEERYSPGWIREAFEIAALENKRSWQYIDAILKRWGSEGKSGWKGDSNDDGKPGRHSPQNQRQKYSQDYQRRRRSALPRTGRG
jgi:DnaD/phage-associated family protein